MLALSVCLVLAFLLLPLSIVVPMSFSDQPYLSFPPPGWTAHWYAMVRAEPRWLTSAVNSVRVGIPVAALSIVFGTLAALALARTTSRRLSALAILVLAPMMLPHIILAIGLYPTIVSIGLTDTFSAVVIGHTVIGIPLVFVTVSASLRSYPAALDLAARTLGASAWATFWRVTLPMIWTGIAAGGLIAFATSFDELILALFLTGADTETLPRMIWDQLSFALTPAVAAVATLVMAATTILLVVASTLNARRRSAGAGA